MPWIACLASQAQVTPLFSASSKAQGAPFDLVAVETERHPTKSYLAVDGFHERTAPGSRWLMCAYAALAMQRGFSNYFVVYPAQGSIRVVVAAANSPDASPSALLGLDFAKENALGDAMMPVQKMAAFCGFKR